MRGMIDGALRTMIDEVLPRRLEMSATALASANFKAN
jgi:hypothetical protein